MRSRLTTVLTIAFFGLGTGGALALVGHEDFGLGGSGGGSASFNQYRECNHGNGVGKDHECHGHEGEHGRGGEHPGNSGNAPGNSGSPGNSGAAHEKGHH